MVFAHVTFRQSARLWRCDPGVISSCQIGLRKVARGQRASASLECGYSPNPAQGALPKKCESTVSTESMATLPHALPSPYRSEDAEEMSACQCMVADDFTWVWVSPREIQDLWEGAPQLSTRRAAGVDPKGGHGWPSPVGRLAGPVDWGLGPAIHGRTRTSHGKSSTCCRAALKGSQLDEEMPPSVSLRLQSLLWRSAERFLVTADSSPR